MRKACRSGCGFIVSTDGPALQQIGDVNRVYIHARFLHAELKGFPGPAQERISFSVLPGSRIIQDQHQRALRITFPR